jgi:hypothetical protein
VSTVSFSFTTAGAVGQPVGTVISYLKLIITNPDLSQTSYNLAANATGASATISQIGNYSASIQAYTAANVPIGSPYTTTFSLGIPSSISLVLPSGINPTVSP